MLPDWQRIEVAGREVDWFEGPTDRKLGLIYLHPVGLESPADNAVFTELFAGKGFTVAAPRGGRCWWVDRQCEEFEAERTPEQFLVNDLQPWLCERLGVRQVAVAGVSMGGQGALRLGLKYPRQFPIVASIAGAIDFQHWHGHGSPLDRMYASAEQCRLDSAVIHLDGCKFPPHIWFVCDPADSLCYQGNDRLHEKLNAYGIPHQTDLESSNGGHTWEYFNGMAEPMLDWLAKAIDSEARRLL